MKCRVSLRTVAAYGAALEATRSTGERALAVFAAPGLSSGGEVSPALSEVGALARVLDLRRAPCCPHWIVEVEAVERVRRHEQLRQRPFRIIVAERIDQLERCTRRESGGDDRLDALADAARQGVGRLGSLLPESECVSQVRERLGEVREARWVAGVVMALFSDLSLEERQGALELPTATARLELAVEHLYRRIAETDRYPAQSVC